MNCTLYEVKNRVATITLNRPEKRNALNAEMVRELSDAFVRAEADQNVKAVILKANGNTFCSGADLDQLRAMQSNTFEENLADSNQLKDLFVTIYTLKKIVVAQVEGHALAGGCGLATVCDFTFCTPESKFGYTEARIGFVPAIVMIFLIRKIGERRAAQLLLSADVVGASEATLIGLVNDVIPKADIENSVIGFIQKLITQNSSESMATTKLMMAEVQGKTLREALDFAAKQNALTRSTTDCKKGVQAFLEKKELNW